MGEDDQDIVCPFCGESGFDRQGLKGHLVMRWCDGFEAIGEINRHVLTRAPYAGARVTPFDPIQQGARCTCKGSDEFCPCQNVADAVTTAEEAA